jgi:hypothetical protein
MRRISIPFPVPERVNVRCANSFAFVLLIVLLTPDDARTQQATYEDQAVYYDEGLVESGLLPIPIVVPTLGHSGSQAYFDNYAPSSTATGAHFVYTGNYGATYEPAVLSNDSSNYFRLTGDRSGSGVSGAVVVVQNGPNGESVVSLLTDFDDLHTFNIAFDQVSVAKQTGMRAYDAGGVYWIYEEGGVRPDPNAVAARQTEIAVSQLQIDSPKIRRGTGSRTVAVSLPTRSSMVPQYSKYALGRRGTGVGLTYGYQEYGLIDRYRFDADGGILGRTYSETWAKNWLTGPQAGVVAYKTIGPLRFYGHALAIAAMNDGDLLQNNGIGSELVPGALNRLLYAQPTHSENRDAFDELAPTGVLWAEAGLQITERTSLKFAWSAVYVDNVLLAEDRVRYFLPDMGLRDPGNQHYLQQFVFCGIEMVR